MDNHLIKTILDYHYGMFDRIWDGVMQLTAAQFAEDNGYSLGSVRNHLVHCMNVDDRWLARLQELTPPPILVEDEHPDQRSVRVEWDEVRQRVLAYANGLTEEELLETIPIVIAGRFAEPIPTERREILQHMVNHGTDHRAQILTRLHELGAPTMEQDMILYLWAQE